MDVQDQSARPALDPIHIPDRRMCMDIRTSSVIGHQSKEFGSSVDDHGIKVRKPYTITKQRERWTEEEHEKFLEALKLYGRAWRRIEEHIGTKTAVQIRSHAQKFFSKVVREPGTAKTIAIPPPRPKRKPLHPYPRKLGNSPSKGPPILEQPEWSSLSIPSVIELESSSPVSVLSAVGSDTIGSTCSNPPHGCTSPESSAARSDPVGTLLTEQENGCLSPAPSVEDENRSPSPGSALTCLVTEDKYQMEVDLSSQDETPKEGSPIEAQATCLKLFGRTVLVTDAPKPCFSSVGSTIQSHKSLPAVDICSHAVSRDMDLQTPTKPALQTPAQGDFWAGAGESVWSPWNGEISPMFYCLPPYGDPMNSTEAASLPWWCTFYGTLPAMPFINLQNVCPAQFLPQTYSETLDDKDSQKENSWTGSNGSDLVDSQQGVERLKEPTPASTLKPSENSAFVSLKVNTHKFPRGFVPYKRCPSE